MWGNFKIAYTDNTWPTWTAGSTGPTCTIQTLGTTGFGEQRFLFDGFAADPGTVAGRDEFRGTNGSLYFLRRQDVLEGSERVRIEVRDKDSGMVLAVKNLTPVLDYDIDYLQGRILLAQPLPATADDGMLVSSGSISGHPVFPGGALRIHPRDSMTRTRWRPAAGFITGSMTRQAGPDRQPGRGGGHRKQPGWSGCDPAQVRPVVAQTRNGPHQRSGRAHGDSRRRLQLRHSRFSADDSGVSASAYRVDGSIGFKDFFQTAAAGSPSTIRISRRAIRRRAWPPTGI
jgi:hypothetical protein